MNCIQSVGHSSIVDVYYNYCTSVCPIFNNNGADHAIYTYNFFHTF